MRAGEDTANGAEMGSVESFERLRRWLSWVSVSIFAGSFVALLVLSGTVYWRPDNHWLVVLDRAWRVSGLLGLALWVIPYGARVGRWVAGVFGGSR
jgi:hypothetical protein